MQLKREIFFNTDELVKTGIRAIEKSDIRYRMIVNAFADISWCTNSGGFIEFSEQWCEFTGQTFEQASGWGWTEAIHPSDSDKSGRLWNSYISNKQPFDIEFRLRRFDGEYFWFRCRGRPVYENGFIKEWIGICSNIDDTVKYREHQFLLLKELTHRVKNTMSIVQALSRQIINSINRGEDVADVVHSFEQRIFNLATTHTLLTDSDWNSTTFYKLLQAEIAPYFTDNNIQTSGDDFKLSPRLTISVGMVLHELLTNAAKYGALSPKAINGKVYMAWTTKLNDKKETVVEFKWKEVGGPKVIAPSRTGFGTKLLNRLVRNDLSGNLVIDYNTHGVEAQLTMVLEFQ